MTDVARNDSLDTDDATGWTITSPLRLDQFTAELQDAAGLSEEPVISAEGVTSEAADNNAVDLTISPVIADATVQHAVAVHEPNASWVAPGQITTSPADVRALLAGGGTLDNAQVSVALADLYSRFDSINESVVGLQSAQQTSG